MVPSATRGGDVEELRRFRPRPREESTAYVGMVVFLASWAMLFVALFFAYGMVRSRAAVWPPFDEPRLPLLLPGLNTAVAGASSALLVAALRASRRSSPRAVAARLGAAALLGALFLALQAVVWWRLVADGLLPADGTYGSVFYALTGFHALHVLVGVVGVALLCVRVLRVGVSRVALRLWGMYWHFVTAVWVALYATLFVL